jgi:hypothetical protein
MSETPSDKSESADDNYDVSDVLRNWDYEPGVINVRRIIGTDGLPKIQMRLELGLLQMEVTGRPDGRRPHGCESLLEYHERRLGEHKHLHGGAFEGFALSPDHCQQLRDEAAMYYQRYLSLFMLGDFVSVVRDTSRNLRVIDLCAKFATEEQDRLMLEQYRPYIIMMRSRASASILFKEGKLHQALDIVRDGLSEIRAFFEKFGHPEAYDTCDEVKVLKRFGRDIKKKLPVGPLERLQRKLKKAVASEDYEEAAKLRDEIAAMETSAQPGESA